MSAVAPLTMLTFGPMIDSETCRLLLRRYGQPVSESRHIFGWASALALANGGTGQIPLVYNDKLKLTGPRAVIDHFESICASNQILIPAQQPLRMQVEADWALFNGQLSGYTARIAYFHLLPRPDLLLEPFERGVASQEARITPAVYPLLRLLFRLLLRLNARVVADAVDHARWIVDAADQRLSDGRRFFHGDKPTLSDISFATAIAPLILPDGYAAPAPPYERLPGPLKDLVDAFRLHPSSMLVQRVYDVLGPPQP